MNNCHGQVRADPILLNKEAFILETFLRKIPQIGNADTITP